MPVGSVFSFLQRLGMKCHWEMLEKAISADEVSLL